MSWWQHSSPPFMAPPPHARRSAVLPTFRPSTRMLISARVKAVARAAAVRAASAISFAAVFLNPGCEAVAGNMYVFVAFIVQDGGRGATGGV